MTFRDRPSYRLTRHFFSGLFDRFPKLQMVFGEINVGWIPAVLENMDDVYARDRYWSKTEIKILPPFDTGEANLCLRGALKEVKFPKFKASEMKVDYPFVLRAQ